jgi:acylphosphatase
MVQKRAHLWISGLVQGVFFRARAEEQASSKGLTGWVKNLPDGKVEILFEGPDKAVDEMVKWCHRGPRGALVKAIEIKWENSTGEFANFQIRY